MFEVIPSGVRLDEAAREVDAGMVIDGEQEGLLGGGRGGHEMGVVGLDVGLDRRAGPDPATEPLQLICDELVVGRILKREELDEKAMNLGGPNRALVSAAGLWSEGGRHAQPSGAQLVEPRATHSQMGGSGESVERSGIEVGEDVADKFDGKTMDELLVFIAGTLPLLANDSNDSGGPQHHPITWSQPGRRPSLRSGLRPGYPLQSTFAPSPIRFCSGSVRFCSGPDMQVECGHNLAFDFQNIFPSVLGKR